MARGFVLPITSVGRPRADQRQPHVACSVVTDTLRDLVELAIVVDPMFDQNCYVLRRRDTTDALVVDPGLQHPQTLALLEKGGLRCDRFC